MIATNTLLSIGFSLIKTFGDTLDLQNHAGPTKPEEVQTYVVGSPHSPVDLYIVNRNGDKFWIRDGAVYGYASLGSYKQSSSNGMEAYKGPLSFSSNQVLELVAPKIRHLAKFGGLTVDPTFDVRLLGSVDNPVPFYWVTWINTNASRSEFPYNSLVEVDGRNGTITYVELRNKCFFDFDLAKQNSNKVYTADSPAASRWELQRRPPLKRVLPYPSTNDVAAAISSWLGLCKQLGINPGNTTNIASIDWSRTFCYTNPLVSQLKPVCQIYFTNGVGFESINGVAFSHYASDSCFTGYWQDMTQVERDQFRGKVRKRWEELAQQLELVIVNRLGIPKRLLSPYAAGAEINGAEYGSEGIKRIVIGWRNWPRDTTGVVLTKNTDLALEAEFDLETGDLKWINFHNPQFIAALRRSQSGN